MREYKKAISDEDEWQNYLKCDDLPDTKKPSDIRSFIYEWQNSLNNHWEQQINWWLKCDDRSVLTQIPEAPDVRRKMMQKLQEPIGKFFDQKLRLLIKVYNSLSDTIRRRKVSSTRYEDLLTVWDPRKKSLQRWRYNVFILDSRCFSWNCFQLFGCFDFSSFAACWSWNDFDERIDVKLFIQRTGLQNICLELQRCSVARKLVSFTRFFNMWQ